MTQIEETLRHNLNVPSTPVTNSPDQWSALALKRFNKCLLCIHYKLVYSIQYTIIHACFTLAKLSYNMLIYIKNHSYTLQGLIKMKVDPYNKCISSVSFHLVLHETVLKMFKAS